MQRQNKQNTTRLQISCQILTCVCSSQYETHSIRIFSFHSWPQKKCMRFSIQDLRLRTQNTIPQKKKKKSLRITDTLTCLQKLRTSKAHVCSEANQNSGQNSAPLRHNMSISVWADGSPVCPRADNSRN